MPTPEQIAQRRQIASRVRAYVDEQTARDPKYSTRQLSLACGWDGSQLGTVLRRLEAGKDQRTETLRTIASTMGKPLAWLETGEMPEGFRLDASPDWAEAVAKAIRRYKLDPAVLAMAGRMRVPEEPRHLDEHSVEKLARFWMDVKG